MARGRRSSRSRRNNANSILGAATVSGGIGGVLAMVLVVWTLWSWYDMDCSFEENCKFPMSSKDKKDETYYMNVKFIIAWIVALPAIISIALGLAAGFTM